MRSLWLTGMIAGLLLIGPYAVAGEEQDEATRLRQEVKNLIATVGFLQKRIHELEALVVQLGGTVETDCEPPSPSEIHESYDRFTGARQVRIDSQPLSGTHKDDPEYRLQLQAHWIARQAEGKPPQFVLLLRHRHPQQLWTGGEDLIMLVDGTRHRTRVTGRFDDDQRGRFEYVELEVRPSLLGAFTSASRVEVRVGNWECEIPGPFRTLIAEQVRKAEPPATVR